ncbi:helix-turn-helix transcriptional regulator [Actinosynnema sp. NPDC050436]|uniref:helix-turn-helix domain-containing protein n=1 Tax=Actinosynnema sp. NPDC050436 TaxID=3155659 RepID=UPI003404642B
MAEAAPAPHDVVLGDWQPLSRALSTAMSATTLSGLVAALDELRREKGMSYARLGRKAHNVPGISRTRAHTVIIGKRDLDLDLLRGFLVVCEVSSEERLRWLGAFDRLTRAPEPEPLATLPDTPAAPAVRVPAAPVEPPAPYHHIAWPSLESVRRAHPRKPRRAPDKAHRLLPWLLVPAVGAPLCAIVTTRHAVPVPTMLGFLVMVALGVALWTFHLPGIDTGRRRERPHVRRVRLEEDGNVFGVDRRAAPPVIGL